MCGCGCVCVGGGGATVDIALLHAPFEASYAKFGISASKVAIVLPWFGSDFRCTTKSCFPRRARHQLAAHTPASHAVPRSGQQAAMLCGCAQAWEVARARARAPHVRGPGLCGLIVLCLWLQAAGTATTAHAWTGWRPTLRCGAPSAGRRWTAPSGTGRPCPSSTTGARASGTASRGRTDGTPGAPQTTLSGATLPMATGAGTSSGVCVCVRERESVCVCACVVGGAVVGAGCRQERGAC